MPIPISGYVFLDTSADNGEPNKTDSTAGLVAPGILILPETGKPVPKANAHENQIAIDRLEPNIDSGGLRSRRPHFRNVLFLSADNKFVYAYIGVLKALEEYGLDVDLVLTESKATLVGVSWALGYSATTMESKFLETSIETFLKPYRDPETPDENSYPANAISPLQWTIPLALKNIRVPAVLRTSQVNFGSREYLHLSWMIAKLTHDAPAGPVEELAATPKPLAIQVTDLKKSEATVVSEGSLQNLIKGALLPADILRKRTQLWPFASGALLSGHRVLVDRLPFTFDRMIVIESGSRLIPSSLDEVPVSWIDSLAQAQIQDANDLSLKGAFPGKVIRIELRPESGFDPEEVDSKKWIELGYLSALRTMDVLKSILSKSAEIVPAPGAAQPPIVHRSLELNRVSLNPLASGGRQLLLDIVRTSENGENDTVGDGSIAAIVRSGFYSDLDLEWTRAVGEERASLIFDTKEHSQLKFKAGINAVINQSNIVDRGPEVYFGFSWEEPFYIPFRTESGVLLGGHRPGYEFRAMITPIYPLKLDLGVSRTHLEIYYPEVYKSLPDLNPLSFRLRRDLQEVFLKIYPTRSSYLRTSVQKHVMSVPGSWSQGEGNFLSTDFQETAYLGLGKVDVAGLNRNSVWLRYRNFNRINLAGEIKPSNSSAEIRMRFGWRDFSISDQYFWSDQKTENFNIYDLIESGRIDAFSFQDEYFLSTLRSPNFQDLKVEYAPTFRKAGLRLVAGLYRKYGSPAFFDDPYLNSSSTPLRYHWEVQLGYKTPIGLLKAGIGGLQAERPFYFLKIGTDFSLGYGELD